MKLRSTVFLSAIARIFASACTSVIDSGSASGAGDLILAGTMASVIASSDAWPTTSSICAISASLGPMWRSTNAEWCSSSRREGVFWDMAKDPSGKGTRTGTSRRSAVCGAPLCPFA
ncbi:hypothetical protein G6F22_009824 [Rhizopus arrhizus]|nr:hypothetical protein G6F22_009824 [Rhizopus arrhizus]